jgi:ferritin
MLKQKIEDVLNEQVQKEAYSSNLYLSMASWAEKNGFSGVAKWMFAQAEEERMHMLKIIEYINERGGHAIVSALDQPPVEHGSVKEMFEAVMKHEQFITDSINSIVAITMEEKDFTTHNWIQWFVTEQIEEEASVSLILDKLNMLGTENMYLFDRDIFNLRGTATSTSE